VRCFKAGKIAGCQRETGTNVVTEPVAVCTWVSSSKNQGSIRRTCVARQSSCWLTVACAATQSAKWSRGFDRVALTINRNCWPCWSLLASGASSSQTKTVALVWVLATARRCCVQSLWARDGGRCPLRPPGLPSARSKCPQRPCGEQDRRHEVVRLVTLLWPEGTCLLAGDAWPVSLQRPRPAALMLVRCAR